LNLQDAQEVDAAHLEPRLHLLKRAFVLRHGLLQVLLALREEVFVGERVFDFLKSTANGYVNLPAFLSIQRPGTGAMSTRVTPTTRPSRPVLTREAARPAPSGPLASFRRHDSTYSFTTSGGCQSPLRTAPLGQ
jgi:hypothetical protein